MLGSELREMPQYSAFLAPPNGQTWHGQLNTSKTQMEMWLYVAGGNITTAPPAGGGGGGRGPGAAIRICLETRRSSIRRTSRASRSSSCQREHNVVKTLCKLAVVGGVVAMTSSLSHWTGQAGR